MYGDFAQMNAFMVASTAEAAELIGSRLVTPVHDDA